MGELLNWLEVVSLLSGFGGAVVAALWAYSKFVVERGVLPPARLWLTCESVGVQRHKRVIQILVHLENLGNSTLIASDLRLDVLYLRRDDDLDLSSNVRRLGRLSFPGSIRKEAMPPDSRGSEHTETVDSPGPIQSKKKRTRGIVVVPHDTFVQAGVHETYTFVTTVPDDATFALVHGSFTYPQSASVLARAVHSLSRKLGLVQFPLRNLTRPRTAERVFALGDAQL